MPTYNQVKFHSSKEKLKVLKAKQRQENKVINKDKKQ